jgi:hypothetical protein
VGGGNGTLGLGSGGSSLPFGSLTLPLVEPLIGGPQVTHNPLIRGTSSFFNYPYLIHMIQVLSHWQHEIYIGPLTKQFKESEQLI